MRILVSGDPAALSRARAQSVSQDAATREIVEKIILDVRTRGDAALLESGRKFDAPGLTTLQVSAEAQKQALEGIDPATRAAFEITLGRVIEFHQSQREGLTMLWKNQTVSGGFVGQRMIPLERVGVYVPGGNATYPSSVFMNVLPAQVAGVPSIFVATPSGSSGCLHESVLAALELTQTTQAFMVGGAAAMAAFAFGTETVPRVDKIVGPGNKWVNEAKRQLWGQVGVDGYAGPSEVCVVADDSANVAFVAADILTQVEHAPDNAAYLIALSSEKLQEVLVEIERQLVGAPREATMRQALLDNGLAIAVRDLSEAFDFVNGIAPEHLTVAIKDPETWLSRIQNAGCILLGEYTPESAGDYCLGPSHTLPTSGAARWQSPINVLDFLKVQSVSLLTPPDLAPLIPVIEQFGLVEGFPAHAAGATIRRPYGSVV